MSLLICSPLYGGNCCGEFTMSCIELTNFLLSKNIRHSFSFLYNESLITRARNILAFDFINNRDHKYLLFIDSDIQFTISDFTYLYNFVIDNNIQICGLDYPLKTISYPVKLASGRTFENTDYSLNFIEVNRAPTGFLLIDRNVFLKLNTILDDKKLFIDTYAENQYVIRKYIYFDTETVNNEYLSEDYFFSELCKEAGFKIYLSRNHFVRHVGRSIFDVAKMTKNYKDKISL